MRGLSTDRIYTYMCRFENTAEGSKSLLEAAAMVRDLIPEVRQKRGWRSGLVTGVSVLIMVRWMSVLF